MNEIVFVAQYSNRLDFSKAESYGSVMFLSEDEYAPEPTTGGHNTSIQRQIEVGLSSYVPGKDFLLLTGSGIPNVIVGSMIARMPGTHKILKWSNRDRAYALYKLEI